MTPLMAPFADLSPKPTANTTLLSTQDIISRLPALAMGEPVTIKNQNTLQHSVLCTRCATAQERREVFNKLQNSFQDITNCNDQQRMRELQAIFPSNPNAIRYLSKCTNAQDLLRGTAFLPPVKNSIEKNMVGRPVLYVECNSFFFVLTTWTQELMRCKKHKRPHDEDDTQERNSLLKK